MNKIAQFLKDCEYHQDSKRVLNFPENFDLYLLLDSVRFGYLNRESSRVTIPRDNYFLTEKGKNLIK